MTSHYEQETEVIAITIARDQVEILSRLVRNEETWRDAAKRIFYAAIALCAVSAGFQAQIEKEKRHETDS